MGDEKNIALVVIGGSMAAFAGGYGLMFFFIGIATGVAPLIILGVIGGVVGVVGLIMLISGSKALMAPSSNYPAYYPPPIPPHPPIEYPPRYDYEKKRPP